MQLHMSTWAEIESFLQRSRTIVVPIGSNEQHGPTGLLGTDWLCPEIIAREAEKSADILIAPTFNIGMAQHHLAFAGTISLRPSTFIAAIGDWVRSLALHGFEKILFLNGHGGNVASIEAAFSELYAEASFARRPAGFALKLANWWDLEGVGELARDQFPTGHGAHATPSEIAITQWAFPESVKTADYAPPIAPSGPIRDALDFRARFPDGRLGSNPGLATRERGRALVELAAQSLARELAAFSQEQPPA
ncbi:Creatinine amidohydrolase [compost metagenome]|uniref:Creatininase family protein n=1 Tax=Cupriavidus campinensis TaxID=151783 RepID=A0AAE9I468_9BURK|nr:MULTISPECIES: creatininase family protein [Cupriavidus]TSP12602.1 creatininase family protein [Cupriavidus campinensis]URF06984.1 creatininase family protein [Cupriavidus campinensis]CAG2131320.1 Creatinine amidohydrolase [Cupriavidus campinensis]